MRYNIFNVTDGIIANIEPLTDVQADQFIADFPKRFASQGYYLTSSLARIDPSDVELIKVEAPEVEADETDFSVEPF